MAAKFRMMKPSYIQPRGEREPRIVRVGEEIEFDGPPNRAMLPLDDEARAACARAGSGSEAGSIAASFAGHSIRHPQTEESDE